MDAKQRFPARGARLLTSCGGGGGGGAPRVIPPPWRKHRPIQHRRLPLCHLPDVRENEDALIEIREEQERREYRRSDWRDDD